MFVVMTVGATEAEILGVKSQILAEGLTPFDHVGAERTTIAVVGEIGSRRPALLERFGRLAGVERVTPISRPFKLTSREFHPEDTVIPILDAVIGDGSLTMMAGPCSIESREQLFETADAVKAAGATIIRGGAFKPRTSPYAFQGLGIQGLRFLAEVRERTGLPVITEVMEPSQVDIVAEYADILQIGTRNMQNYSLLRDVGRVARPVMLKRGYGATVEEFLMAAEYIVSSGNPNVILCERGIRTFETYTRNTLDLAAVPLLHQLTHLPVVVDPSHATGKRWLVKPLAVGGVAVGADGIMVEVHPNPDEALSDAEQQLDFAMFARHDGRHPAGPRGGPLPVRVARGASRRMSAPAMSGGSAARVRASGRLRGDLHLPGDKSISHRALILAALATGESRIAGAGDGADVRSTAAVMAALGATVDRIEGDGPTVGYRVVSPGADGLVEPDGILDCGNSGTSLRLISGMLAGLPLTAVLDGDDSLRRRPVARIIEPLRSMGAVLHGRRNDSLPPLTVVGRTPLRAIEYTTAVPSAQVKSAILLAGLRADGRTTVREAVATRDHTERMLRARGVPVERTDGADGSVAWTVDGGRAVAAIAEQVPGDVSAAAFWLVAGAIHPDAELVIHDVGVNPTRRAVIDILRSMGADIDGTAARRRGPDDGVGEPLADLVVRSSSLHAVDLGPAEVAAAIDEIPILCLAAAAADGTTRHPRRGRAAPQGIGPDRGHGRRSARARAPGSRSTATTCASPAGRPCTAPRRTASTIIAWP